MREDTKLYREVQRDSSPQSFGAPVSKDQAEARRPTTGSLNWALKQPGRKKYITWSAFKQWATHKVLKYGTAKPIKIKNSVTTQLPRHTFRQSLSKSA